MRSGLTFALFTVCGMDVAQHPIWNWVTNCFIRGKAEMKEVANSFAQLAAIIMILITLAVSTAAISQLAGF